MVAAVCLSDGPLFHQFMMRLADRVQAVLIPTPASEATHIHTIPPCHRGQVNQGCTVFDSVASFESTHPHMDVLGKQLFRRALMGNQVIAGIGCL